MIKKYTPEEFWKIYEKLPEDLKDALFSEETAKSVNDIYERNEIENSEDFVELIGHVLAGLLPPDDFKKSLMGDLGLDPEKAEKVALEVERFIFAPVKNVLSQLYNKESVASTQKPTENYSDEEKPTSEEKPVSRKPISSKKDTYREAIE